MYFITGLSEIYQVPNQNKIKTKWVSSVELNYCVCVLFRINLFKGKLFVLCYVALEKPSLNKELYRAFYKYFQFIYETHVAPVFYVVTGVVTNCGELSNKLFSLQHNSFLFFSFYVS